MYVLSMYTTVDRLGMGMIMPDAYSPRLRTTTITSNSCKEEICILAPDLHS
jgi:hypothetical protein